MAKPEGPPAQNARLKRDHTGNAVVTPDCDGIFRYMYRDGSHDSQSTVDFRNPTVLAFVVGEMILTMPEYLVESVEATRLKLIQAELEHSSVRPQNSAGLRHLGHLGRLEIAA